MEIFFGFVLLAVVAVLLGYPLVRRGSADYGRYAEDSVLSGVPSSLLPESEGKAPGKFQEAMHAARDSLGMMHDSLEIEKEEVLTALNELEFDYQMKKLSDDDYRKLKASLTARAVSVLKAKDEVERCDVEAHKMVAEEELEKEIENEIEQEIRRRKTH